VAVPPASLLMLVTAGGSTALFLLGNMFSKGRAGLGSEQGLGAQSGVACCLRSQLKYVKAYHRFQAAYNQSIYKEIVRSHGQRGRVLSWLGDSHVHDCGCLIWLLSRDDCLCLTNPWWDWSVWLPPTWVSVGWLHPVLSLSLYSAPVSPTG